MRHLSLVALGLSTCLGAPAAFASDTGLPTDRFVQSWTALPTGHFTPTASETSFKLLRARAAPMSDDAVGHLLDDAFASARDDAGRRNVALLEMTAPWDQQERSAFQRLRDTEAAYAGSDEARNKRFVATLTRVVDGIGRSSASDGSASDTLENAYAATLARNTGDARVAAEADQARWRTYSDAFTAFADLQMPGSADYVSADLQRQRASDLAAPGH